MIVLVISFPCFFHRNSHRLVVGMQPSNFFIEPQLSSNLSHPKKLQSKCQFSIMPTCASAKALKHWHSSCESDTFFFISTIKFRSYLSTCTQIGDFMRSCYFDRTEPHSDNKRHGDPVSLQLTKDIGRAIEPILETAMQREKWQETSINTSM